MVKRRLHQHQVAAFGYARTQQHPALFLEMRLGKTLIAIRTIQLQKLRHILVVAPSSALGDWHRELDLEGEQDVCLLLGTREQRQHALEASHKWYLFNKEGWLALPQVREMPWDAVILDESTFIKNPRARITRFYCSNFRSVPHRWILTGTPNPESELDFFCQFLWLDGGETFHSHNFYAYRQQHYKPIGFNWVPRAGVVQDIIRRVAKRAFVLRRKDVQLDSPRVYERRMLTLPPDLRETYTKAEESFVLEVEGVDRQITKWIIEQYTWLRQLCGGFIQGSAVWNGKIQELVSLLQGELARQRVVVWFRFNAELQGCNSTLQKLGISTLSITGDDPVLRRQERIMAFREGRARILLLQVGCSQYGVDLSCADTAIYYSSPLDRQTRAQSEDRIVSVQQKRPVLFIDLLVEDSVDKDIYALLKGKALRSIHLLDACRALQERRSR